MQETVEEGKSAADQTRKEIQVMNKGMVILTRNAKTVRAHGISV